VVISLAGAITDRPVGGFITGNELSATRDTPPARDDVPIEALEEVVAANPDVTGMRMALADRLFAEGRYPEAGEHYLEVLQRGQQPQPRALTRLAWLAAADGNLEVAIQMADAALQLEPADAEALWVRADLARAAGDDEQARRLFSRLADDPSLDQASRDAIDAALRELGAPSEGAR
jgi:tetratricopeptide (TPR) repeat protein